MFTCVFASLVILGKICKALSARVLTTHAQSDIYCIRAVNGFPSYDCVIHYIAVWFSSQKKRSCCRNSGALGLSSTIAFQKHLRRFCCCHVAVVLGTHGNGPYVGMDEKTKWRLHTMSNRRYCALMIIFITLTTITITLNILRFICRHCCEI